MRMRKDVVREGSVQSNHPELMWKNSTHLVSIKGAVPGTNMAAVKFETYTKAEEKCLRLYR